MRTGNQLAEGLMGSNNERIEKWQSRPRIAWLLRAAIFVAPILIALFLVVVLGRAIPRPESWLKTLGWWVALSLFATGVILILDRLFRKLLPIVALFKLSLVFPDRAPPRFKTALRSGTVRQLQRRMANGEFSAAAPQAAAEAGSAWPLHSTSMTDKRAATPSVSGPTP